MFAKFAYFTGNKRTSVDFLEKVREISKNINDLKENLQWCDLFSDVTFNNYGISLIERPNEVKMNYSSAGNRKIYMNFPNIFGNGERVNMRCEIKIKNPSVIESIESQGFIFKISDFVIKQIQSRLDIEDFFSEISRPVFLGNCLGLSKMCFLKKNVNINEKCHGLMRFEHGITTRCGEMFIGLEKINNTIYKIGHFGVSLFNFGIRGKIGQTKSVKEKRHDSSEVLNTDIIEHQDDYKNKSHNNFLCTIKNTFGKDMMTQWSKLQAQYIGDLYLKLCGYKKFRYDLYRFFFESTFEIGRILGKTHLLEKYFLNIRGYRSRAITPINQNQKLGGTSYFFARNSLGMSIFNSEIFGFYDIGVNTQNGLKGCLKLIENNESSCVGKSVGIGIRLNNAFSCIYAMPLTKNLETEKFQFGFDITF